MKQELILMILISLFLFSNNILDEEPLLFVSSSSYSNPINKVKKASVDKALSSLPKRESTTLENMYVAMKKAQTKYSLNEAESAYLVYKWLSENIKYDCYNFVHNLYNYDVESSYSNGEGVCYHFSSLFYYMCESLGLEAILEEGYSKGASYVIGTVPSINHDWNVVKIDSIYYLIDVTWGSGTCNGGETYTKKFTDFYFCPPPEAFIRRHLPLNNKWQLLPNIITLKQFTEFNRLSTAFFKNNFKTISPDLQIIEVAGKSKITLTYDKSNKNLGVKSKLFYKQGNDLVEQNNTCFNTKIDGVVEVNFITTKIGEYLLKINARSNSAEDFTKIVEYKVISTKASDITEGFPSLNSLYSSSESQLIEPLHNPLKKGRFYSFKVKSTFSNLYVLVGGKLYRQLDKGDDGIFSGDNIYIFGDVVKISTHNGTLYNKIVQYTTMNDPDMKEEPSFPKGYSSSPKNILYSPLLDTLKKGSSYTFKIECKDANEIVVIDGSTKFKLTKNGLMFTGTLKIDGSTGQVKISIFDPNASPRYSSLYLYNTS